MKYLLLFVIFFPLLAAFLLAFFPEHKKEHQKLIKNFAFQSSLLNFLASLFLWIQFDSSTAKFQYGSFVHWLASVSSQGEPIYGSSLTLGVDGISLFFIILTTFLTPVCLFAGWSSIQNYVKEYCIAFLVLETLMIAVFCTLDLLLFYVFFESVLIPMFIIIGVWGSRERKIRAAYQFFLYTLFGSVLMLLAILLIFFQTGTTDLQILLSTEFSERRQLLLFLAFFASFAVKVPMVPVHIWLPEAHVEAPTAGSVILAGILLKLGTYGFLRFSIPMFPEASLYFAPLIYSMSLIAIVYTSLTTLRQIDLKKIIAYSSVAHMNFVTIGLFSLNAQGIEGSLLLMLSHGLVSPALFLCVGVLYDRHKTRILKYYGGCVHTMPVFSAIFLFFTLANINLPGTSSFVGEFLVLVGVFQNNPFVAIIAATSMVLGAAYALWLYNRVVFGHFKAPYISYYSDLNRREFWMFLPFILGVVWMGVAPNVFLDPMHCSVANLII
jgi:proton-translocating NADH-quinone oxidoreductase chain M